jgi:IclR family pca regulon transcriptional regulator
MRWRLSDLETTSKSFIQSLGKGFRVLEAFTAEMPELVLAEVARRTGTDNATAFRVLNTLVMLGYVEKVSGTRKFRLTLKCLDLGYNAIARSDLRTLAQPILRALVGEVNEAASIGVLDGADILYVERIQAGLARLGVDVRIGSKVPVYSTAVGQAIIAWLPRAVQVQILESRPRDKLTDHTLVDLDALLSRLDQVRARGYALSDQENVFGLRVLAAPVLGLDGAPVAALSVAGPASRMQLKEFEQQAWRPVLAAATQLSRALHSSGGYAPQVQSSKKS